MRFKSSRSFVARTALCAALLLQPFARSDARAQQTPPLNGIAHAAIRVSNLEASRVFYKKLGFEEAFTLPKNSAQTGDPVTESFIKINDRQFIELYPTDAKNPRPGFLHLCFEGADLEAIAKDYTSRGIKLRSPLRKAGAGNLLFTMDGPMQPLGPQPVPQNIEYTQYMPGSLHSSDFGQHLGPDRVADKLIAVALAMEDPAAARDFYINQLDFKPIAGDPMDLHMPGDSGQEVEIVPAEMGSQARLTFNSPNLGRAARHLHKEGIVAVKNGATLTITDPDGNILLLESR